MSKSERRNIYCTCCGTEPMGYWFEDRVYWFRKSHGKTHSAVYFFGSEGPPAQIPVHIVDGSENKIELETNLTGSLDTCYPENVVSGQDAGCGSEPDASSPESPNGTSENNSESDSETELPQTPVSSDGSTSAPSNSGSLDPNG